jgi:superfamily II DNA/RNA helicase
MRSGRACTACRRVRNGCGGGAGRLGTAGARAQGTPPLLVPATVPATNRRLLTNRLAYLAPLLRTPKSHAPGVVEELIDCSGGDEISLESGVARKLEVRATRRACGRQMDPAHWPRLRLVAAHPRTHQRTRPRAKPLPPRRPHPNQALSAALDRHRAQRVIVFCNKIEACRAVENHLNRRHGRPVPGQQPPQRQQDGFGGGGGTGPLEVYAYHEGVREASRQHALHAFLAPAPPAGAPSGRPVVLVCTDRTSRGIDSVYCEHVVLFDFPRDPSEYVRRAGRTARGAGGRGVVSVLVLGKQVPLAQQVLDANQKGRPVHRIPEAAPRW